MKTYAFRRVRESAEDIGACEIGLAVVQSLDDLFWTLDEFGNPYEFEYSRARPGDAVHAWQRDAQPDVLEDTGRLPADGECFVSEDSPRTLELGMQTISEGLQEQGARRWTRVDRSMCSYEQKE